MYDVVCVRSREKQSGKSGEARRRGTEVGELRGRKQDTARGKSIFDAVPTSNSHQPGFPPARFPHSPGTCACGGVPHVWQRDRIGCVSPHSRPADAPGRREGSTPPIANAMQMRDSRWNVYLAISLPPRPLEARAAPMASPARSRRGARVMFCPKGGGSGEGGLNCPIRLLRHE